MKTASSALITFLSNASQNPNDMAVFCADLYTFTLVDGTVLRYSSGDRPVTIGGHTFNAITPAAPGYPAISRSKLTSKIGLDVTELEVDIFATPTTLVEGMPILQALDNGLFDGATVLVERLIQQNPTDISLGKYIQFGGTVGDVSEITGSSAKLQVKALTEYLNLQMPRNLFQPGCRHALFDAGCSLSQSSFTVTGAVVSGTGMSTISFPTNLTQASAIAAPTAAPTLSYASASNTNILAQTYYVTVTYTSALGETTVSPEAYIHVPARNVLVVHSPPSHSGVTGYNIYVGLQSGSWWKQNGSPFGIGTNWQMGGNGVAQGIPPPEVSTGGYFTGGVITFTSGVNSGLSFSVRDYIGGAVFLVVGALATPSAGDTFTIIPGCDKQISTCLSKYNNLANFAGTPFIPTPEASL